jgi:hypothetical protein
VSRLLVARPQITTARKQREAAERPRAQPRNPLKAVGFPAQLSV